MLDKHCMVQQTVRALALLSVYTPMKMFGFPPLLRYYEKLLGSFKV